MSKPKLFDDIQPAKYTKDGYYIPKTLMECFQITNRQTQEKRTKRVVALPVRLNKRLILNDLLNERKWNDPSGQFRRRVDLVKSYVACYNGLKQDQTELDLIYLKGALWNHYKHLWPTVLSTDDFTKQKLLDYAEVAHKNFPIKNEKVQLDIDRKLIVSFVEHFNSDMEQTRRNLSESAVKRLKDILSGTGLIPRFYLEQQQIFLSRYSPESTYRDIIEESFPPKEKFIETQVPLTDCSADVSALSCLLE